MRHHDTNSIYVDENQALLLKMLFSAETEMLSYYQKWIALVPFDFLDGGSFRLMPMLYKKLAPYGLRDERYEKIKGIYRYTLYKNSIIMSGFHKIAQALHNAGIRVMLLKGGALILKYYQDRGVRPMNDIDLLIEKQHVRHAIDILSGLGWQDSGQQNFDLSLNRYPTITLLGRHGFELDLHWNIMTEYGNQDFSSNLWQASSIFNFQGVPIFLLGAEDQIMHNCAHGVKWNELPPIRWIPDVLAILNTESDLSWTSLALKCRERKLTMPVRSCLRYLKSNFNAPVPDIAMGILDALPVSKKEHGIYTDHTKAPTFARRVVRQWRLYRKDYPDRSWIAKILLFPGYLKMKSGIERYRDCMRYICLLALNALRRRTANSKITTFAF